MKRHAILLCLAALPAMCADDVVFDRFGRIVSVLYDGEELPLRTSITLSPRGPSAAAPLGQTDRTEIARGQESTWKFSFPSGEPAAQFEQRATITGPAARLQIRITAAADIKEGAWFWMEVPRADFAGGSAEIRGSGAPVETALRVVKAPARDLLAGEAAEFGFTAPAGRVRVSAEFGRSLPVFVREKWDRNGRTYFAGAQFSGPLGKGETATFEIQLAVTGTPDAAPARLILDSTKKRYKLSGFGGDYCFNIESPITRYTLENLNVAWARTEMSLSKWEPENDNDDPAVTDWNYLTRHDTPESRIRHELELMKAIQRKHIPYVISIWQAPDWLYGDPDGGRRWREKRRIPREKWDEMAESITSYLLYARKQYGVEPDLFSFNEANIGINVLISPEEHREMIKFLGRKFEQLGLKTKMLLGDATGPRGTHEYALPAANDPDAMRYVGAVAFHSWGGAAPEQYSAWGDLAEWLGLPLLVTELGVDAGAHRGRIYDTFHNGMREVQMYQEILLHARPQATIQWEFTPDYGIVTEKLVPTSRFWLVKHFSDLTPRDADALGVESDSPKVLFTAFSKDSVLTLHLANMGTAREVTITGVPAGAKALRVVRTSDSENFKELPVVEPQNGLLHLKIPARCLTTLTNMPVGR